MQRFIDLYDNIKHFVVNAIYYRKFLMNTRAYDFRDSWLEVTATMLERVSKELEIDDLHVGSHGYSLQAKKAAESARRATEDYWLEQSLIEKNMSLELATRQMKRDEEILFNILRRKSGKFWC